MLVAGRAGSREEGGTAQIGTYVSATAIQKPETTETKQEMKMVPRRPKNLFKGAFVQHPIRAEQAYGAPLRRPWIRGSSIPNSSK